MFSLSSTFATLLNIANKAHPDIDPGELDGRSFCVAIDELPQDIAIRIDNGRVLELAEHEIPDVTISGSLKAIVYMVTNEADGLDNEDLYISGKMSTARQVQRFLSGFSLDWARFFAQFMSDENADKTAEAVKQGLHVAKGSVEDLKDELANYLIHEKKIVVTGTVFDAFKADVAALNQRLDSLLNDVAVREK